MTNQRKRVLKKGNLFDYVHVTSRAEGKIPADNFHFALDESQVAELIKDVAYGKREIDILALRNNKPEKIKITIESAG